jgi:hypothetical protein
LPASAEVAIPMHGRRNAARVLRRRPKGRSTEM